MRLQPSSRRRTRGSTLMTTLFMAVATLTYLGTCLSVVSTRYKITTRSRCWNAALPLAEAGVEEALTHIHDDTSTATNNGWSATTLGGLPVFVKQRNFSDGSYYYITLYNASSNNPVVYSTGFVPTPLQTGKYLSRTVKVSGTAILATAAATTQSFAGFAAVQDVQLSGSGLVADSFNSSKSTLSTGGQYDPNKTSKNGNVGSQAGIVDLGNCNIQGSVYVASGAKFQSSQNQITGLLISNAKLNFPDVVLPATTWQPAPGGNKHDFIQSGDYYVTDTQNIIVEAGVSVRLRVDTSVFYPGNVSILTASGTSGKLSVYQVSGSVSMFGNANVANTYAQNFSYYGLPNVNNILLFGNTSFTGCIYAPEADCVLSGNNNLYGSAVTKSISLFGNSNFHYDEALGTANASTNSGSGSGTASGFTVTAWQEL